MNYAKLLLMLSMGALVTACPDDGGRADSNDAATGSSGTAADGNDDTGGGDGSPSDTVNDTSDSSGPSADNSTGAADTTVGDDDTGGSETGDGSGSAGSSTGGAVACEGMSFFVTSVGSGAVGGNLGGLVGADQTCQTLAMAAGQGACTWRAYLSTTDEDARDRIGEGPWMNAAGDVVAADLTALHTDGVSNGKPMHMMDENGASIPAAEHDILTGSEEDGTVTDGGTCADWTSDGGNDGARVGHSDIPGNPAFSPSWNAAHTVGGCSQQNLISTNGAGRLYCFAAD